ncbi:MAG: FMN-binding protein [Phycisphaerales bacterium JB039]
MTSLPQTLPAPEPSGFRLVFTLAMAGLLSGLAIVGAYEWTLPIIEANNAAALRRAVFKVVPGSEQMQGLILADGAARPAGPDETADVYAAYSAEGAFIGYAIAAEGAGFQDTIRLLYGYDPGARQIIGMEILESRETPGLGDKIYKDAHFVGNFDALAVDPPIVAVKAGEKSAPNEVDAITGATISSKAVVRIIGGANDRWLQLLPAPGAVPPLAAPPQGGAP